MNRLTGLRVPCRGSSPASAGSAPCETPWPGRTIRSSVAYPFVDARLIKSGGACSVMVLFRHAGALSPTPTIGQATPLEGPSAA